LSVLFGIILFSLNFDFIGFSLISNLFSRNHNPKLNRKVRLVYTKSSLTNSRRIL